MLRPYIFCGKPTDGNNCAFFSHVKKIVEMLFQIDFTSKLAIFYSSAMFF